MTIEHAGHHVRRYADERGHTASCVCGWRVTATSAAWRDQLANRHETQTCR